MAQQPIRCSAKGDHDGAGATVPQMRSDPPEDDVACTPASAALRALRDRLRESMLSLPGLVLLGSVVVALVPPWSWSSDM